jgi:hypothetical protein
MPLTLDKCGNLGGDVEMVAVVKELALRHPHDEFVLVGRNSGENPQDVGLPSNVVNPWRVWGPILRERVRREQLGKSLPNGRLRLDEQQFVMEFMNHTTRDVFKKLDGMVMWMGQHGSSNAPIPMINDRTKLTHPQDAFVWYAHFLLHGVNVWRDVDPFNRDAVYLNADARNRHKMRDLKHPLMHPVLTQYNFSHKIKHERYSDDSDFEQFYGLNLASLNDPDERDQVWNSRVDNVYSRLEVNGLAPGTPFGDLIQWNDNYNRAGDFGMFINEARAIGIKPELSRLRIMNEWVLPLGDRIKFLHGTWTPSARGELRRDITPASWNLYYPKLNSVRCTFTTPSSGSGWATAKPWEAFAGGTVCFFHPAYDDQDNILGDADPHLRDWLRVSSPAELMQRVDAACSNVNTFKWLITKQREHFDEAMREKRYLRLIERRLYGD